MRIKEKKDLPTLVFPWIIPCPVKISKGKYTLHLVTFCFIIDDTIYPSKADFGLRILISSVDMCIYSSIDSSVGSSNAEENIFLITLATE